MRRELLYPVLLACADTVENSFWKQIITDMAHGSCPTGSYISNGTLTTASFAWEIPNPEESPSLEKCTEELVELLQENLGIFSEEDKAERQEHFYQILASKNPNSTPETWPDLKKVYGKEIPIADFVAKKFTVDGELNLSAAKRALADINLGLGLKTITNDDIIVKNGRIVAIPVVDFYLPGESPREVS